MKFVKFGRELVKYVEFTWIMIIFVDGVILTIDRFYIVWVEPL